MLFYSCITFSEGYAVRGFFITIIIRRKQNGKALAGGNYQLSLINYQLLRGLIIAGIHQN